MTGSAVGMFCLGVLVGFLVEWLWDWAFWRRSGDAPPADRKPWTPGEGSRGPAGNVTVAAPGQATDH